MDIGFEPLPGWRKIEGVTCVECPNCGFEFNEEHRDQDTGGYSCPVCLLAAAREGFDARERELNEANRRMDKLEARHCEEIRDLVEQLEERDQDDR